MAEDQTHEDNLNEEVVDQSQEELEQVAPQDEAQTEEVQEEEEEQPQETDEQEQPVVQQEEPAQPSRRERLRIQSLLQKYGNPYEDEVNQVPSNQGVDYRSMIDADDEVYNQLEQVTQAYGNQRESSALEQAQLLNWKTNLKIDAQAVNQKHPELDVNSENFNPALADAVNEMYVGAAGFSGKSVRNPALSYSDYVDAFFELVDEAASRKTQATRTNITRQASRTGLRPDGSAAKSLDLTKAPSQMSDAELDAVIKKAGFAPKK